MVNPNTTQKIEELAAEIGDKVYMDITKWHLYLSDAKLHTVVAEKLYPILEENELREDKVLEVLREIPIKIGGGKKELSLLDLLPMQCQVNLMDLLEEYQRKM